MFKKCVYLYALLLSVFLISSCHYMGKSCCSKTDHHLKHKKSCCKKTDCKDRDTKKCRDKKSHHSHKHRSYKKSCCGKDSSVVGYAEVQSIKGGSIKGEVFFEQMGRHQVQVKAEFTGLKPNQKFGFHVHEFGNCKNKALMAGGHFNPWKVKHGHPNSPKKHMGDLGNLSSDASGKASYSTKIKGRAKKFFGRSVIVHAQEDDLKTQPTGNSGERIACGVIVTASPK